MPVRIHKTPATESEPSEDSPGFVFPGQAELTAPSGKTVEVRQATTETRTLPLAHSDRFNRLISLDAKTSGLEQSVKDFVSKPVPPPRTPEFEGWLIEARSLDQATAPFLIRVLERGTEAEQYAALLALRQQGYEAWGSGYDDEFVYLISYEGRPLTIKPLIRDE